jgi:DNA repair photolyase
MPSTRGGLTTSGSDSMVVRLVECRTAVSPSRLPGLDWAINPYRGCGHACSYCYAQDVTRFETGKEWGSVIEVKINIVQRLKKELEKSAEGVYGIGTVTDPYQPVEKQYELTRGCLVLLKRAGAKLSILTKSDLILRDLDIISDWDGAEVGISIGCPYDDVAAVTEPGACSPSKRFEVLAALSRAGISSYLMAAPILPGVCDSEEALKVLVSLGAKAGVRRIIWDVFNPKPMATPRLRRSLSSKGLALGPLHTKSEINSLRRILSFECSALGIGLSDAF